jgi:hypothetical protein
LCGAEADLIIGCMAKEQREVFEPTRVSTTIDEARRLLELAEAALAERAKKG